MAAAATGVPHAVRAHHSAAVLHNALQIVLAHGMVYAAGEQLIVAQNIALQLVWVNVQLIRYVVEHSAVVFGMRGGRAYHGVLKALLGR